MSNETAKAIQIRFTPEFKRNVRALATKYRHIRSDITSRLLIFCPITNQVKGYPFEVELPSEIGVTGVILSDQIKSLDWRVRKAEFKEALPEEVINDLLAKLGTLLA